MESKECGKDEGWKGRSKEKKKDWKGRSVERNDCGRVKCGNEGVWKGRC